MILNHAFGAHSGIVLQPFSHGDTLGRADGVMTTILSEILSRRDAGFKMQNLPRTMLPKSEIAFCFPETLKISERKLAFSKGTGVSTK
jgi:hypothetical protein